VSDVPTATPRAARNARIIKAVLFTADGRSDTFIVKSVSRHGLGGRTAHVHVSAGDVVTVDLPLIGRISGSVRWTRGLGTGGLAFGLQIDAEIDLDRLRFDHAELPAPPAPKFSVADRFKPATSTYRPGFKRS
jgi:hypothetical protein